MRRDLSWVSWHDEWITRGMTTSTWNPINAYAIRDALMRDKYVYATASAGNGREFRIYQYKTHRSLNYGRELATGKWVVIGQWQTR